MKKKNKTVRILLCLDLPDLPGSPSLTLDNASKLSIILR